MIWLISIADASSAGLHHSPGVLCLCAPAGVDIPRNGWAEHTDGGTFWSGPVITVLMNKLRIMDLDELHNY